MLVHIEDVSLIVVPPQIQSKTLLPSSGTDEYCIHRYPIPITGESRASLLTIQEASRKSIPFVILRTGFHLFRLSVTLQTMYYSYSAIWFIFRENAPVPPNVHVFSTLFVPNKTRSHIHIRLIAFWNTKRPLVWKRTRDPWCHLN